MNGPKLSQSRGNKLVDSYGRIARKLRVSVTDRCNFRCLYCLPDSEITWLPRESILTFEEIYRIVHIAVNLGVQKIRLTGGEPLVRKNVEVLVHFLRQIPGLASISMTTNGYFLLEKVQALKDAGLDGLNISLDTLSREKFAEIVRRDAFDKVIAGIQEARRVGFTPVKINVVLIRGINDDEIEAFTRFARDENITVRFIEFMPLDSAGMWRREMVISAEEILQHVHRVAPFTPVDPDGSDPAKRYVFDDGRGEIGIISSVSQPFCHLCDRIRLTADGFFRTCLFATKEFDLKPLLRGNASDQEIADFLASAVSMKEEGHLINLPGFVRPTRTMHAIGG